jgi:predicted nucleotidyltransferase
VANQSEFQLISLLQRLVAAGVDFVVIGGVAVYVQANPRFTKDLDICYALDHDNLERLGEVLIELQARLASIDEALPFVPDGRTLKQTQILTLTTSEGAIDLLAKPDGCPAYETLRERATTVDLDDVQVLVASIEDLIAMKQAAGRPQDLVDVEALEVAREQAASGDRAEGR